MRRVYRRPLIQECDRGISSRCLVLGDGGEVVVEGDIGSPKSALKIVKNTLTAGLQLVL